MSSTIRIQTRSFARTRQSIQRPLFTRSVAKIVPSRAFGLDTSAFMQSMPQWTLDQIVGLAFGGLLVTLYLSANVVDKYVARVQRAEMGLCEECGGLYEASTCMKRNCPLKNLE